jgi:NAD(P)-dependent dehydrogenase (short-subunit alcohol dehydrogenase family)
VTNELAGKSITVNAIAPGYIETDNTEALRADPVRSRQLLERIPAGRWGVPEHLKTAALFLAAPRLRLCHRRRGAGRRRLARPLRGRGWTRHRQPG